jgi:hypothetical protein
VELKGWVGFDFDGTLAKFPFPDGLAGGEPIEPMWMLVEHYLKSGYVVKIVTGRAVWHGQIENIQNWLNYYKKPQLPIVAHKDTEMLLLFDDRVATVETNSGKVLAWPTTSPELRVKL